MERVSKIACILSAAFILAACQTTQNKKTTTAQYSTWDIIEKTEAMAPKALSGRFLMTIKNSGKLASRKGTIIFLNTEKDYRDRRNISIKLSPEFQAEFNAQYPNTDIRNYYQGKNLLVQGEARRVKIWFNSQGKRSDKYYFQTHVFVNELTQLKVQ
ncbi:hypothetical protein OS175_10120 [Marinicella sp. S1101]|uniref:hypothetical protein n=1 Tax=Marinicella marina TaxID=2996016 RepID=UPI002260AC9E|nr:hypothetical protein [Marinicella marina]MCX7554235.1 hypothetical protein [Marinicella marina]MDJ1138772.1 hypothetical protein [Marinicella marina]